MSVFQNKNSDTENRSMVTRGRGWVEVGEVKRGRREVTDHCVVYTDVKL